MDTIMQERIERFNQFIISQDIEKMPIGLFNGKMGLCIYFYHQARYFGNKDYQKFALNLLESVYNKVNNSLPIDMENGLTGICNGIIYLIDNKFVKGNPNSILTDLDDKIFSTLYFIFLSDGATSNLENLNVIVNCSLYFCRRLSDDRLSINERGLMQQIVIRSINKIESTLGVDKMIETFPFSPFGYFPYIYFKLIAEVYRLDFFSHKTKKICDEWTDRLLSLFPLLQSHRVLLAESMSKTNRYYNSNRWHEYIMLLNSNSDINYIIKEEFRDKNMLIKNGLCGFYSIIQNRSIDIELKNLVRDRILNTDCWVEYEKAIDTEKLNYVSLMSGLSGIILTYQKVTNS